MIFYMTLNYDRLSVYLMFKLKINYKHSINYNNLIKKN